MTEPLVIDASLAFRLILPGKDQVAVQSLVAKKLAGGCDLNAPSLWAYELTSAITKTVHCGQITGDEGQRALTLALHLGVRLIAPDDELVRRAFAWTLCLERAAAYDSFYLALAERLQCELWTADRHVVRAVDQPWVRLARGDE